MLKTNEGKEPNRTELHNLPLREKIGNNIRSLSIKVAEVLMRKGQLNFRTDTFSKVLTDNEKEKLLKTIIAVFRSASSILNNDLMSSFENLKARYDFYLTGEGGIRFENNSILIGPESTEEDIKDFILSFDTKSKADNLILDRMDELNNLKKSLGEKGFIFETIDDPDVGIKLKSDNPKVVIIGNATDLESQIIFLRQLENDPDYAHVNESISKVLEPEEENILAPAPLPKLESVEELLRSNNVNQNKEAKPVESKIIDGIRVNLEGYDPSKSSDEYDVLNELDGAIYELDKDELEALKASEFKISIQDGEKIIYPVYLEGNNTLNVGFLNTGEDILNSIRNTVLPYLKNRSSKEFGDSKSDKQTNNDHNLANNNGEQIIQNSEKERILQELSSIRLELAEMDALNHKYSGKTGKSFFTLKDEYNLKKEELLKQIEKEIRESEIYGPLTPQQERLVKSKFNDELYKVLKSENDAYNNAIKKNRGLNILDKTKEGFRNLLGTEGMKWYMGLSRTQRFAINTALFSIIATGVAFAAPTGTAGAAIGAGFYRIARGAGAFAGSSLGMGVSNKILRLEELQEWKIQEEQKIKNSEGSIEEKSKKIEELEKEFNRRLRNFNLKKIAISSIFGGVGGAVSGGILDYAYNGSSPASSVFQKSSNTREHLGGETVSPEPIDIPKMRPVEAVKPENAEIIELKTLKKIFGENYKGAVLQNVPRGGSLWSITKAALLNNEKFESLSTGQQNNILAFYVNKIINSPEKFGFEADPKYGVKLQVDKQFDLSKAFNDSFEFEKVISRAERMSPELEAQEVSRASEIENSYQVSEDIMSPEASIKVGVPDVSQIDKPSFVDNEFSSVTNKNIFSEAERADFMSDSLEKVDKISEKINQLKDLGLDAGKIKILEDKVLELKNSINYVKDNYTGPGGKVDVVDDVLGTSEKIDNLQNEIEKIIQEELKNKDNRLKNEEIPQREVLKDEIAEAKKRLADIEGSRIGPNVNESVVQKRPSDLVFIRSMASDATISSSVEQAFKSEIDEIYGDKGFLGFGRVVGINSKDWGLMRGLSASEVLKYFTGNSEDTNLSAKIINELAKSSKHQRLGRQLIGLIEETDGKLKPYNNENVEDFLKRLGRFVMEQHSSKGSVVTNPNTIGMTT